MGGVQYAMICISDLNKTSPSAFKSLDDPEFYQTYTPDRSNAPTVDQYPGEKATFKTLDSYTFSVVAQGREANKNYKKKNLPSIEGVHELRQPILLFCKIFFKVVIFFL